LTRFHRAAMEGISGRLVVRGVEGGAGGHGGWLMDCVPN